MGKRFRDSISRANYDAIGDIADIAALNENAVFDP